MRMGRRSKPTQPGNSPSSDLLRSLYTPLLTQLASTSIEQYAASLLEDSSHPTPLYSSTSDLDSLSSLLTLVSHHNDSYRIRANAAKFERRMEERYGRLRPLLVRYPSLQPKLRSISRMYSKLDFSPVRPRSELPLSTGGSAMLLLALHRRGMDTRLTVLVGCFVLVGLKSWAVVGLVVMGKFLAEIRRRSGRVKRVMVTPYYGGDVREKYEAIRGEVGTCFNPADFSLRDERYDGVLLGEGPGALYAGALLARCGKKVCVLGPSEDCSGCTSVEGVPFDIGNNDVAFVTEQQSLLAPALCTSSDAQGGIRFARIGTKLDGYTHSILEVPGLGTCSANDPAIPIVLDARGHRALAEYCHDHLGDGYPTTDDDGNDDGSSTAFGYLESCRQIDSGSGDYFLSKLFPDRESAFQSPGCHAYRESTLRTASSLLDKCLPLNPHVRSLMAAIGGMNENSAPDKLCMAAHIGNVDRMTGVEGLAYPVGGPRALCHALASVIEQCGGRVVRGVKLQELLFEGDADKKGDGPPRCRGVRLENGMEVTTSSKGSVLSFLGLIPTFLHLIPPELRSTDGVPSGLPALSERRPLMKILVNINGTKEDLNLTGADWYRLPNATLPRDEMDRTTGIITLGTIGVDRDSNEADGPRGKFSKQPRTKFTSGVSWMKISFPSAKDPSWKDRYGACTTCVVTVEADDDFVKLFDTKPKMFSIVKDCAGDRERLRDRVLKDLVEVFPQLDENITSTAIVGPIRAGLANDPPKFVVKGNRPKSPHPGLCMGGSDLTMGESFSGSISAGWLVANAIMEYSLIDQLYLRKNITSDLSRFGEEPRVVLDRKGGIVEDLAVPFTTEEPAIDDVAKNGDRVDYYGINNAAESSKEE